MVQDHPRGFPTLVGIPRAEREARMFKRKNLEHRLALLKSVLLPTLRNQTDPQFVLAVLTTENLPPWAMKALRAVLTDAMGARAFVVSVPPKAILRQACRAALRRGLDAHAERFVTFRIDDDDGLALSYVSRLREHLEKSSQPEVLTFVPGLECDIDHTPRFRRDRRPFSGAGLATIHHRRNDEHADRVLSVYQLGPHRKVAQHLPATTINADFGFLRLIHGANVSGVGMSQHGSLSQTDGYQVMRKSFGFADPEALIASLLPH
jgi:hypothetical protein